MSFLFGLGTDAARERDGRHAPWLRAENARPRDLQDLRGPGFTLFQPSMTDRRLPDRETWTSPPDLSGASPLFANELRFRLGLKCDHNQNENTVLTI